MAKYCGNCGSELIEGARACGNCGTFVDGSVNIYTQNNDVNNENVVNENNNNNNINNAMPNQNTNVYNNVSQSKGVDYGTIGFVVSLISTFLCCGMFNIVSFILCLIGLIESKKNPDINIKLAIAGIIISCSLFIFILLAMVLNFYAAIF